MKIIENRNVMLDFLDKVKCPACKGDGKMNIVFVFAHNPIPFSWDVCSKCEGTGIDPALKVKLQITAVKV